jgi:hypothetical protein
MANMTDYTVCNADDTPVFINNIGETSEVTCACCDKFKIELQKTNRTQISTKNY